MKHVVVGCLLAVTLLLLGTAPVQAQWYCQYATWDHDTNGTGHNTTSVAVVSENTFVALVMTRGVRNFMVPYKNADSVKGRLYGFGYGSTPTSGLYQLWTDDAFDQVSMYNMFKITATSDGTIYGANNDAEHNILVFKFANDTIKSLPANKRQPTGTNSIFAVKVDQAGYVYVCNDTTNGKTDDIKIYQPVSFWTDQHNENPVRTVDLPDGVYKGMAVSPDGKMIFVGDYKNRKILKYKGSVSGGYTLDQNFVCELSPNDTIPGVSSKPSVLGLAYKPGNNILFAATTLWISSSSYGWSRIQLFNPNTGKLVSTDSSLSIIDCAGWNARMTTGYNLRSNGTVPGNASGYASNYDVEFDAAGNLYTQSHYGWTVDKWSYQGTLPTISLTEVVPTGDALPESFELGQNFPNPFNPTTQFSVTVGRDAHVAIAVYDMMGRQVATLANEVMKAGTYRVTFDASHLSSGTYYCRMTADGKMLTRKMILMK